MTAADRRDYRKDHRRNDRHGNSYHPYRSAHSNGSSSSSRLISVADAMKTDRILSIENFVNAENIDFEDQNLITSYFSYVEKHQVAFLKSLFKREKSLSNTYENDQPTSVNLYKFDSFDWNENLNLKYSADFGFRLEESSSADTLGSSVGVETFLCPRDATETLPFNSLLPSYNSETVAMSNIPAYVDKSSLEGHLKAQVPDCEIELSQPNPDKNYYRLGWLSMPAESTENLTEIVPKLESLGSIEGAKIYFGIASSNFRRFKVSDIIEGSEKDLCLSALEMIKVLEKDEHIQIDENTTGDFSNLLDKMVAYLRKAHNFCFYCCAKFGCSRELVEKCGDLHLRRALPEVSANINQKRFVERTKCLIMFMYGLSCIMGSCRNTFAQIDEVLTESSIKKVEEGKYRCEHCAKAFKGPEFVLKHLHLKHEDVVKSTEEESNRLCEFLDKAKLWMFPSSMIPRYTSIRNSNKSGFRNSRGDSQQSSKSSFSSKSSRGYVDWDATVGSNSSTEISYDL